MKRIILLLLTASLICGMLSCGNEKPTNPVDNDTSTDDTSAVDTTPDRIQELGSNNFEGRTFTILDANDYPSQRNIPDDSENGEIVNDALYRREMYIENLYNIDIEYVQENAHDGTGKLKNSVLADDREYDLCLSTILGGALGTIANEGVLANLMDIQSLSLSESWWSSLLYDSLQINGKMYYTSGDISPVLYISPAALFINTNLLEDYNIEDDICSLVLEGKWTIDRLAEMVKAFDQDIDNDGKMHIDNDFFGYLHLGDVLTSNALLTGAGVDLCENTADGIKVELNNEKTINAVEKLKKLVVNGVNYGTSQDNVVNQTFVDDRAIVIQHFLSSAQLDTLRNMQSDFIVAPLAKYDEDQENYHSLLNAWNACFIGVPANADFEYVGLVTEALAYYSYKNVRPQCYELLLKAKAMRDEQSTQMVDIIFDSAYIDFNALYDFGGVCSRLKSVILNDAQLSSTIASLQPSIDATVESLVENW
ncbi:MAG: extracellular solute-binding protein [Clostridiales bacterium]|nr:extracellular solute-binding protein [Clostridiales bacterium]